MGTRWGASLVCAAALLAAACSSQSGDVHVQAEDSIPAATTAVTAKATTTSSSIVVPAVTTTSAATTSAATTSAATPSTASTAAGTTSSGATPAATTPVVATAPAAVPPTAATTLPPPAHPDGDYVTVGADAFAVTGVFCDVLGPGAGAAGSVEGEIREIDGTAEGLGPFYYAIDDRGFADGKPRDGLFSASSTAASGAVFYTADDLVVDAPVMGPAVLLGGKGALDPDNTRSEYLAALDSAIGADRMTEINSGAAPTAAEQATILQLHDQYYSTPFSLSVTCPP
jgi:hypothetical protein